MTIVNFNNYKRTLSPVARTLYPVGHFASREGYVLSRCSADRKLKRVVAVARKFPKTQFAY